MTLKTILKNFLNYADTLDTQKKQGNDVYEIDFQKLKALTEELKRDEDYTCSEGLKEVNRRKNRYKDILPYDYTRVILSEYPGVPGSDYINANYIKGASGSLAYIASQGPLPNTVVDFWRMIWECEVQVIVMACNEQESGKYKCECYWPSEDEKKQYGNITVEFVKWRQVCPDFLVRTLKASWEDEERVICQFHYTTWPDHGVPNSVQPILELVRLIRDCQASEAVPVLVHCSAGCGRTGTICAIDYVWGLMRMGKLSKSFNLFNVISDMRRQRIAMVQTREQYIQVHKAVSSLFEQQLRVIDSHTYENLDEDGEPLILKEMLQQEEDIYEDILDPLLSEENSDKSAERKLAASRTFHEYPTIMKESSQLSSDDVYPQILSTSFISANNVIHKDDYLDENKDSNTLTDQSKPETVTLDQNDSEGDCDVPYSRNSKILLKLCREESVKRLISGWNKAAESDKIKNKLKDMHYHSKETETDLKTMTKKQSNHAHEHKTPRNNAKDLGNTENNAEVADNVFEGVDSSKCSSPEDAHAGKLVGKATVIRRPSIAKLKALFEKSSQASGESETNRQRRPLFRSHSHYVSQSSRAFTVSDSSERTTANPVNLESPMYLNNEELQQSKDLRQYAALCSKSHLYSQLGNFHIRGLQKSDEVTSVHSKSKQEENERTQKCDRILKYDEHQEKDIPLGNILGYPESSQHYTGTIKVKLKQSYSLGSKKEKPPELPLKKKPSLPLQAEQKFAENIVPRFHINIKTDNDQNSNSPTQQTDSVATVPSHKLVDITSPNSHFPNRYFQEAERRAFNKTHSFSDPEQSASKDIEASKVLVKPKLSLTDETQPKIISSKEATSNDKPYRSYENAYMNVNSITQRNIRQIEDKLKNHPRGAIIDLTSRKSYIDEVALAAEKPFNFKSTAYPVKFSRRQESRDLTPSEKSKKIETSTQDTSSKHSNTTKNNDADDIGAKNLLLHSPPPKSKRNHASKSGKLPQSLSASVIEASSSNTKSSSGGAISTNQKETIPKTVTSSTESSSAQTYTVQSTANMGAADRSDPRYFPVNRQTASDAKYESERQKITGRNIYNSTCPSSTYGSHYGIKQSTSIYHKLPHPYENKYAHAKVPTSAHESKGTQEFRKHYDNDNIYGLQRSTSGPQILPAATEIPKEVHRTDPKRGFNSYSNQTSEGTIRYNRSENVSESQQTSHYEQSSQGIYSAFPPGPPKPPRTYHYEHKSSQDTHKGEPKRDGGRYIISVASPKHSNVMHPKDSHVCEYRQYNDPRTSEASHPSHTQACQTNYSTPLPNEIHMSRSYPVTNYESLYAHPRPYGKQFYPESMEYRNIQPFAYAHNNIYSTIKSKPAVEHQNVYSTIKHRGTFPDYENACEAQMEYLKAMSKNEPHSVHQSNPSSGVKYSQINGHAQKNLGHPQVSRTTLSYDNEDSDGTAFPKKVYFDTLQRRNKQRVTWEQRRSHDDMDIHPPPSSRLREQIHARRSMVELDNLEISVAADENLPEKNFSKLSVSLPTHRPKAIAAKGERSDVSQKKIPGETVDLPKDYQSKKNVTHNKESISFGETLSKALGKLTSFKFNMKESHSNTPSSNDNNHGSSKVHVPKCKDKDKVHHNFVPQPPVNVCDAPTSEQWTQV